MRVVRGLLLSKLTSLTSPRMETLSDQELYNRCREYGGKATFWRRKFTGLLPEVYRRGLHEKKGYSSIFEFAARLAGLSREQVKLALSLDESFEGLPCLRSLLTNGEVSIHKLVRVRAVATEANQEFLAQQALHLSQAALGTLAHDMKQENAFLLEQKLFFTSGVAENQKSTMQLPPLSQEVVSKLAELHHKGIDVNALLLELLEKHEQEIQSEKEALAAECEITTSRYIPMAIRRVVEQEHGTTCSMPGCGRPSEDLHHTQRFALAQRHDPRYLAPLCKNHHQIAHSIDVRVQEKRKHVWKG